MWIIPKNLQLSSGAPDTAVFISDLNEQSQICASSLMVRSKPSRSQTWSQKWKRDSWTALLSGRILRPSHAKPFETEWTSLWPVIPASRLAQQENDLAPKTLATSGRTSPDQYELFAPECVFSRTSKDTSASDSERSSQTWEALVIKRRGEYSARVKSARLTSASGSSSWPTIRASEYKDVGPVGSKSHDHMLGKGYLCAVVTQDAANWPTPCAMEAEKAGLFDKGQMGQSLSAMANRGELSNWPTPQANEIENPNKEYRSPTNAYRGGKKVQPMLADVCKHGQAAPANHSTLGSRQGLWLTPRASEPDNDPNFAARNADRGAYCHGTLSSQAKQLWPTITAHTPDMESNGPNGHSGTYLAGKVKQWGTPAANDANKTPHCEVNSNQAGLAKSVGLEMQKQWGTPTARDHKSGRGNEEREYKELTPMVERTQAGKLNPRWVETLMGLPVGWVMPSCKSPVTIELTNCAFSATESFQQQQSEHLEF